jgi:hypothetical protein
VLKNEFFALNYFLEDYPRRASFKTVIEIVKGDRPGWVEVWGPFQIFDSHVLVGLIMTLKGSLDEQDIKYENKL